MTDPQHKELARTIQRAGIARIHADGECQQWEKDFNAHFEVLRSMLHTIERLAEQPLNAKHPVKLFVEKADHFQIEMGFGPTQSLGKSVDHAEIIHHQSSLLFSLLTSGVVAVFFQAGGLQVDEPKVWEKLLPSQIKPEDLRGLVERFITEAATHDWPAQEIRDLLNGPPQPGGDGDSVAISIPSSRGGRW